MTISFNSIPSGWKLPLYYVETDPSKAGQDVMDLPIMLVGQKLSSGLAAADTPIAIGSVAQAQAQFGIGSMLERMVNAFFKGNQAQTVWCLPVVEPAAGAVAAGAFVITGTATAAGTLSAYIAGQRVQVAVNVGDTAAVVATALYNAINAATTLPVTATNGTPGTASLAARWKGASGNDVQLSVNFGGAAAGEALPAGISVAITAMSGGTASPTLTNGVAALGEDSYEFVALPFADSTSLGAFEAEFGFGDAGRWGWLRQLYGHVFSAMRGTYSALITFGATRNTGVTAIHPVEAQVQSPIWEVVAASVAQISRALINDPARPLQTLPLTGIVGAPRGARFAALERNALVNAGFATLSYRSDNTMQIEREATTYKTNAYGVADGAYSLVTTLATLAKLFRNQKAAITLKYGRHKLANNGTRFGPGQAIVTPNIIRGELVAQYQIDEEAGLVENAAAFAANLIVERDASDTNRLNVLYPPDLVNQLRIFAVLAQFRLNYTAANGG